MGEVDLRVLPVSRTANIISDVQQGKHVTLRGAPDLALARTVLEYAVRAAGSEVVFDPASAPDLVDYLTVTAASALDSAAIGTGLGAALGLSSNAPRPAPPSGCSSACSLAWLAGRIVSIVGGASARFETATVCRA
jgi:hypothetical protein